MASPLSIDGSLGEGGGQVLRTALGLSMVTGRPFRIDKIRAGRAKPGLLRQHLTAVNAATAISNAKVEGATIGSQSLSFAPGPVAPGEYTFSIGSAGSTMLVLQAILPALLTASGPTKLTLEGGTHNPFAPPFDFVERVFLPLLARMGADVRITLDRAGFFPAGGGRALVTVHPTKRLTPIEILERGDLRSHCARASVAALPGLIARRETDRATKLLGWTGDDIQIRQFPESWGPGNVLTLEVHYENVSELVTCFGEKNISAEEVAARAVADLQPYLDTTAPVGEHLADQLLIPLALAGGSSAFRTAALSSHSTTNIDTISRFLPARFDLSEDQGTTTIRVS